jgi:hypothetical protein
MSQPPPGYRDYGPPLGPIQSANPVGDPSDPLISPDYSGWWQRNLALVRAFWRPLALLQVIGAVAGLVLRVPTAVVQALGTRGMRDGTLTGGAAVREMLTRGLPSIGIGLSGALLAGLIAALVALAGMRLLVVGVTGGPVSIGEAMRGALGRLLPFIGWGMVAGLIILGGVCACLLPAIYFAAVFSVLPAVVLFERGGAIGRCFRLFHADLGASVARVATLIGIGIAAALVIGVVGAILGVVAQAASSGTGGLVSGTVLTTVFSVLATAVVGVLQAPLTLTTYADERARLEPLNTSVLAHELATA